MHVFVAPSGLLDAPVADPWGDPVLVRLRARAKRAEPRQGPARLVQLAEQVAELGAAPVVAEHARHAGALRARKRRRGEPDDGPDEDLPPAEPRWFGWAEGAGPRCRVLFLKVAASDMERDGLFADDTPEASVCAALVAAGLPACEVAALNVVPWPHADRWGEYKQPPEACLAVYAPYAADAVAALRPTFVVTHNKATTELAQRGLDPAARRADPVEPGLMARLHAWPTKPGPTLLRLQHPYAIRADAEARAARADAIARLCAAATRHLRTTNPIDVLMGRARPGLPEGRGRLRWAAGDLLGAVSMPEPAALAELGRTRVALLVNLTRRAVPAAVCRAGALRQVHAAEDLPAALAAAAAEARNSRVLLVCADGHSSAAAAAVVAAVGAGASRAVDRVVRALYGRAPTAAERAEGDLALARQDESEAADLRCEDAGCERVVGRSPSRWHDAWRLWWAREEGHRCVRVERFGRFAE